MQISDSLTLNSFEQCNQILKGFDDVDLQQYMELCHRVPYDHDLVHRYPQISSHTYWLETVIDYLLSVAAFDPRDFRINIHTLEPLGFKSQEYESRLPKWFQSLFNIHDTSIKKERRLLNKYKLVENIDFIVKYEDMDGVPVDIGHCVNRIVLYKMITLRYGVRFTECVLSRMGQILYYFNEYKKSHRSDRILTLQRTVVGLTEDLGKLSAKIPKYVIAEERDSYRSYNLSPVSSELIMDDKEYADELTTIHQVIEASINRVDCRISDINSKLVDITCKIDDLVGSINLNSDDAQGLRQRFSLASSDSTFERMIRSPDPILNHVNSIFSDYRHRNVDDAINRRNTVIGIDRKYRSSQEQQL